MSFGTRYITINFYVLVLADGTACLRDSGGNQLLIKSGLEAKSTDYRVYPSSIQQL